MMKFIKVLPIVAALSIVLMASCQKDRGPYSSFSAPTASSHKDSNTNKPKQGTLAAVNLRMSGNFVILSKSGITNVYKSTITGDIGTSPITGAAILVSCAEVAGF
jgi:isoaspartyl peptidase/L-asparaginase-like protein (Ntn-hydrolase superfamily)